MMRGGLRLCDLAGSERLDRTGTLNDSTRLKETVNINKSLSSLADVFIALANKAPHIPYRNSKLTTLLQDCLSGDGKALMFVNVSPTMASGHETLCSLRFASQVSQVELGKASKQIFSLPPQLVNEQPSNRKQYLQPTASSAPTKPSRVSVTPTGLTSVSTSSIGDNYVASDDGESFSQDMPSLYRSAQRSTHLNIPVTNQRPFSSTVVDSESNKAGMAVGTMVLRSRSVSAATSKRMSVLPGKHSFVGPQPEIDSNEPMINMLTSSRMRSGQIVNAATLSRSLDGCISNPESVFQVPTKKPKTSNSLSSSFTSTSSNGSNRAGWR